MSATLLLADLHCNSSVALAPNNIVFTDGDGHRLSGGQYWLLDNWNKVIERVTEISKHGVLRTVFNGDLVDGDAKDRTWQIITRNPVTITHMCAELLEPLAKVSSGGFIFIKGTPAHVGKSGNLEELVADDFDISKEEPDTKSKLWPIFQGFIDDVKIQIAHHGSAGGLTQNKKLTASKYAAKLIFDYAERKDKPPDIAFYGHSHLWSDSYDNFAATRCIFLPSWSLATEYIEARNPGCLADNGAVILWTDGGKYEIEKIKFIPRQRIWTVL
jgi:hypothetical protein